MEKTKCWLFIFVLIFAAVIAGSVAILNVSDNQTIDDFELEMVEGYDPSVIEGVGFNVKYGLSEDGFYEERIEGEKCEFQYIDGEIQNLIFTEAKEKERRGEGIQPWEVFDYYEWISDNRVVALDYNSYILGFMIAEFDVIAEDAFVADLPKYIRIKGILPQELNLEDGSYKYPYDIDFWCTDTDVYFFERGGLYKVSKQELATVDVVRATEIGEADPVYYEPFYVVPEEIEVIVGCEVGEVFYLTGIGDVTMDGYNLYTYIVDLATGETIDRQCYEKKLSTESAEANQLGYDYLAKDSYSILTITQPTGYQDMFVIDKTDSESKIHNLNVSDLLSENLYISGLLETENNGDDTLYLIYAEGQINKSDYDANWSRRVIMNLEERLSVECPSGYNIWEVGYNGIAFIAIQNGKVVYKGYFASESSKAMGYTINHCMENGQYHWDFCLPEAYVEQITISVP